MSVGRRLLVVVGVLAVGAASGAATAAFHDAGPWSEPVTSPSRPAEVRADVPAPAVAEPAAPAPARPVVAGAANRGKRVAWRPTGSSLRAVGIEYGADVGHDDLVRAAGLLGVSIGRSLDPHDVDRIVAAARQRTAPALWAAGIDFGASIDDEDLARAAAALGLDVGNHVDATDVVRTLAASSRALRRSASARVSPGLTYERWDASLGRDPAVAHVLRWRWRDRRVDLRVEPSAGLGRRVSVPAAAARRAGRGAVAVVNGGLWLDNDNPDGLLVSDGRLLSDATIGRDWVRGQRGAFALLEEGYAVGRPGWRATLEAPGGDPLPISGVNRPLGSDDLVAYTPSWGASTRTPPGSVTLTLADLDLGTSLDEARTVTSAWAGNTAIPDGGVVLAASGRVADALRSVPVGAELNVSVSVTEWQGSRQALASGPLLISGAARTGVEDWETEGFGARHTLKRHPRTALGFTEDGEAMLVVVDGRQPDHSVGMTVPEMTALLRSFGATDAVMLDGGGSSTMVVGGRTLNQPCCDARPRPVASVLTFYRQD